MTNINGFASDNDEGECLAYLTRAGWANIAGIRKSDLDALRQSNVSMLWMLKDIESFLRNGGYDTRLVREAIRQNGSTEWGMQMLAEQKRLVTERRDLLKACKELLEYVESDYGCDDGFGGAVGDVVTFARDAIKNAEGE